HCAVRHSSHTDFTARCVSCFARRRAPIAGSSTSPSALHVSSDVQGAAARLAELETDIEKLRREADSLDAAKAAAERSVEENEKELDRLAARQTLSCAKRLCDELAGDLS
ncbi:MAG: hypothetical protein ACREXS_13325, partial [Gammaproteobacteria bacterium]